jgi:hypothetical protein
LSYDPQFLDSKSKWKTYGIQRGILWSVDSFETIKNYMKKIRLYQWYGDHQSAFNLTEILNDFIKNCYNDHRSDILHKDSVHAISSDISHNKITSSGISALLLIASNQSNKFFNYASLGRSTTPETIGQRHLIDEEVRVSMIIDGGIEAMGNLWNHVATFGYGVTTGKYYEIGIHDGPQEPSTMFSRSVLPAGIDHTQNESFMTVSHTSIWEPS